MTWELAIQILVATVQLVVAVATLLKLIQTHNTFNSKMDTALQAQRSLGNAEGRLGEKAAQEAQSEPKGVSP